MRMLGAGWLRGGFRRLSGLGDFGFERGEYRGHDDLGVERENLL
jgi:hypothetical protein